MKKKILQYSLTGAPIGVLISLIITIAFSLCFGNGEYLPAPPELIAMCEGNETTAVIVQTVCSLIIGAIFGGAAVIWQIEKWSLLKQTLSHFAIITIPSFVLGYVVYWIPHRFRGAALYICDFFAAYAIVWLVNYFPMKAKIKKFNKRLQKMRQNEEEN